MSKVCDSFSFEACRYNMHKSKESTARITMWKELKIPAVYTMEASFCGADQGKYAGVHFTTEHLMEIGRKLCLSLLIYCDIDVPKVLKDISQSGAQKKGKKKKVEEDKSQQVDQADIAEELRKFNRKALISELMGDKKLLNSGNGKCESGDDGGGSDSDPSEDNMEEDEIAKIIPIKAPSSPKKKTENQRQRQLPIRKQFKQEETKEVKQQTQNPPQKKPTARKFNSGGSFFDRVRLPKSFGLRRVEMVDAWT